MPNVTRSHYEASYQCSTALPAQWPANGSFFVVDDNVIDLCNKMNSAYINERFDTFLKDRHGVNGYQCNRMIIQTLNKSLGYVCLI